MRVDLHFHGGAPMGDVGASAPAPTQRRCSQDDVAAAYEGLARSARTADALGYHTMWLTEHHFQHEGYQVTPNLILMGLHLAGQTRRLHFGQLVNVVPQWHPLRLAEDFAMADLLTGGRMEFGVGRGAVPREVETLGGVVASGDNEMSRQADARNRDRFEEAMEVIRLAWSQERFSYSGKHFTFPPPGVPDRGATVTDLTLVPRPRRTIPIYQPVSSVRTLEYCARVGHRAVVSLCAPQVAAALWDGYAEAAARHGRTLAPGEDRALALPVHVGATRERAIASARDGHDELCRFLAPYGRFQGYLPAGGGQAPFTHQPTLEESVDGGVMAIGSVDDVVDAIGAYQEPLGLRHLVLFPDFPGLSPDALGEQLHLLAEEVLPRLGVRLRGPYPDAAGRRPTPCRGDAAPARTLDDRPLVTQ